MKKNLGAIDRLLRIITAIIIIVLTLTTAPNLVFKIIVTLFGLYLLTTGILAFCPVYLPFKLSTIIYKRNRK
jgi:hypothetical protein